MRRPRASSSASPLRALLAFSLLCACASAPTLPPDPGPAGAPPRAGPLPRSSIAAVLLRGGELGLDPEQVAALADRDAALAARFDRARAELGAPRNGAGEGGAGAEGGRHRGGPRGGDGVPPGGGMGGPPSGGRGGGMGPPGGPPPGRGGGGSPDRDAARAAFAERADEEDTRAWLEAEPLLRPEQREAARAIASEYRAARYDLAHGKRPAPR